MLQIQDELAVEGDAFLLRRAIGNLLERGLVDLDREAVRAQPLRGAAQRRRLGDDAGRRQQHERRRRAVGGRRAVREAPGWQCRCVGRGIYAKTAASPFG